jgi:putative ABC transport system substrate-binding protein
MNNRRKLIIALGATLLSLSFPIAGQQLTKVFRIGVLLTGSASTQKSRIDAFRQGLHELDYVEGKNVVLEIRYAEGKQERFADLAAEMVRLKPDVTVVGSTGFTAAAKQATNTIPIVVGGAGDLVGTGLVASLARPGGNVTGSTDIAPDLSGKRLELLKEAIPKARRVAVLWQEVAGSSDVDEIKQTEIAARAYGIKLQVVSVQAPDRFQDAFAAFKKGNADALVIIQNGFTNFHSKQLLELAAKNRLPTMCEGLNFIEAGCLISYGSDQIYQYHRAATFVDKILKGAKPADLPVEQPTKFELVINMKPAKALGIKIPNSILVRADRVIE